jgi:hypothetical protein
MMQTEEQFPQSQALTKEQKIGFFFLLGFGMIVILLGGLQLRNTIYNPYAPDDVDTTQDDLSALLPTSEEQEIQRLQQIDTDRDGLSNYDELYFYETSQYLPDTDSDGLTDKQEIDAGTNPLCPEGQICTTADEDGTAAADPDSIAPDLIPDGGATEIVSPAINQGFENSGENPLGSVVQDPEAIRTLLLTTGGLSEEQVAAFSDRDLLLIAQQILAEQNAQSGAITTEE